MKRGYIEPPPEPMIPDIIIKLMKQPELDTQSLLNMCRTNKAYEKICRLPQIWMERITSKYGINGLMKSQRLSHGQNTKCFWKIFLLIMVYLLNQ